MSKDAADGSRQDQAASHAYLFAAKGIQRYILDSGPLRDLVGASDLVAGLAAHPEAGPDLIGRVLKALDLEDGPDVAVSRRGASAFCLHADRPEALERVRALWRLTIGIRCPGLECAHAGPVGAAAWPEALAAAYQVGSAVRDNTAAELPPAGHMFTEFNRRTGRAITALHDYRERAEPADMLTLPQRRRAQSLQSAGRLDGVARRFLVKAKHDDGKPFVFPRNMEPDEDQAGNPAFPFRDDGDDRRIGVIHADLSGLGEIFMNVAARADTIETIRNVGAAIEAVVEGAAQVATQEVLVPWAKAWPDKQSIAQHVLPARPVVLGGDDITVLVRADLAVRFAERLLLEIERRSKIACETFRKSHPALKMPERLSACAGVAIVNAGAPFLMAQALADDLCKFAKKTAKAGGKTPYPSYLAFHNAQSTLQEGYDDIHGREMTANSVGLTGNPHRIHEPDQDPEPRSLDRIMRIGGHLDKTPRGSGKLIEMAQLLFSDRAAAEREWQRWRQVMNGSPETKPTLAAIDAELSGAAGGAPTLQNSIGLLTDALELADFGTFDPAPGTEAAP